MDELIRQHVLFLKKLHLYIDILQKVCYINCIKCKGSA